MKSSNINRASQCMLCVSVVTELCNAYRVRSSCDVNLVLTDLLYDLVYTELKVIVFNVYYHGKQVI